MSEPIRISPQEARQKVTAGQALLVCAYEDAAGLAAKLINDGFTNVKVMKGGVAAWKAAGYAMV